MNSAKSLSSNLPRCRRINVRYLLWRNRVSGTPGFAGARAAGWAATILPPLARLDVVCPRIVSPRFPATPNSLVPRRAADALLGLVKAIRGDEQGHDQANVTAVAPARSGYAGNGFACRCGRGGSYLFVL